MLHLENVFIALASFTIILQVIDYCTLPVANTVAEGRRALIRNMWTERIQGTKRNVEVYTLNVFFDALEFSS